MSRVTLEIVLLGGRTPEGEKQRPPPSFGMASRVGGVERMGLEPTTPGLQSRCSPN